MYFLLLSTSKKDGYKREAALAKIRIFVIDFRNEIVYDIIANYGMPINERHYF